MNNSFIRCIVALLSGLALGGRAHAGSIEIVPQVGYDAMRPIDLSAPHDRMDIEDKSLIGLSIGYVNEENGELELAWTHSHTRAKIDQAGGIPAEFFEVKIDRLHMNALYMFDPAPFQPFILAGLGATRFYPAGDHTAETRFSFALGCGIKWIWNDHIGLRFDARWTPAVALPGSDFFCDSQGTGCYTTQANSYINHALPFLNSYELLTGLILKY